MLITPDEVIAIAGSDEMKASLIKESKIIAAEYKYIKPVFGDLYPVLSEKRYRGFVDKYIKPALAYYVRYMIIPDMSVILNNGGLALINPQYMTPATDHQRDLLQQTALSDAVALLQIAVDYVETHREEFPEYRPRRLNSKFYGGIIL